MRPALLRRTLRLSGSRKRRRGVFNFIQTADAPRPQRPRTDFDRDFALPRSDHSLVTSVGTEGSWSRRSLARCGRGASTIRLPTSDYASMAYRRRYFTATWRSFGHGAAISTVAFVWG